MKHIFKGLLAFILPALYAGNISAQQLVSTDVQTLQKGKLETTVSKAAAYNQVIYAVQITNKTGKDQNIQQVNLTVNAGKLIPNGTTYMIGADEMQENKGQMARLVTGVPANKDYSNMFVMFKLGEADYQLVGMVSWRTFLCKVSAKNGLVNIAGDGDSKLITAGKSADFDKVIVLKDKSWQSLLSRYADALVKENRIKTPPKVTWTGWSTWDYYAQKFDNEDVYKNIKALQELNVKPNIIQIDGGWWKQRGDYFDVRDNIVGGIKAVVEKIHQDGYKAGLHFDGFRASAGAKIAKEHPEYFLHNADGSLVELGRDVISKDPLIIWDYSHPGALAYIRSVMKNAKENWKIDYFKIDFMRQGLTKGISHLPVTNVERFRMGVKAMKEGMGSNVYFLGCSSNFGTLVGLADANRMGADIQPNYRDVRSRAKHTSGSYYMQGKVWNVDPDYLVVRNKDEMDGKGAKKPTLSVDQAAMWANYVSVYGNDRFNSDDITLLKPEKKQLIQSCMAKPFFDKVIPMDMWDHYKTETDAPCFYLAKNDNGTICIGLFNWDNTDAVFNVNGFTQNASLKAFDGSMEVKVMNGRFSIPLKGVHSVLLQYKGKESFETLSAKLKLVQSVHN